MSHHRARERHKKGRCIICNKIEEIWSDDRFSVDNFQDIAFGLIDRCTRI